MKKITSWVVLGVGIALIIGSVLVSRVKVSTAAFATGYYEILAIEKVPGLRRTFLLNKNTGATWLLTEDKEKGAVHWLRIKGTK